MFAIACAGFIFCGVYIVKDSSVLNIVGISFFTLCLIVFLIQLIPGSSQLKLNEDGFTITTFFKDDFTSWKDVKTFKAGFIGPNKAILLDYVDNHNKYQTGKKIAKVLSGSDGGIPQLYGCSQIELLEILTEWKNEYSKKTN